jgi:hypothetical protein
MIRDAGPTLTGQAVRVRGSIAPQFLARHALSPVDAIPFQPANAREAKAFAAMRATGCVVESSPGHFHLDLPACHREEDRRRRKAVPRVILACVLVAVLAMLFYRG